MARDVLVMTINYLYNTGVHSWQSPLKELLEELEKIDAEEERKERIGEVI